MNSQRKIDLQGKFIGGAVHVLTNLYRNTERTAHHAKRKFYCLLPSINH